MGNSINKISFYDMQNVYNNSNYILINTLDEKEQDCLIPNTLNAIEEVQLFNYNIHLLSEKNVIIYGKNCNCDKLLNKYKQLKKFGIKNIYLYCGGLFEWLLLQEIYGDDNFPTTTKVLDVLKFKPVNIFNNNILLLH